MTTLKKAALLATVGLMIVPAAVFAAEGYKNAVKNTFGNTVKNTFGNCVVSNHESPTNSCDTIELSKELRNVYFDFNKSTLNAKEKAELDQVAKLIKGAKGVASVDIVGFADQIGKDSYNKALSAKRAANVKQYLASKGLKTRKVSVQSLGESKPVTNCDSDLPKAELVSCLAEDRRVEIKLNLKK